MMLNFKPLLNFIKHFSKKRNWILIPIEIKVRELESKILLACCAAEKDFGVIIGQNGFNFFGNFPRGIYFDKSITKNKFSFINHQVNVLKNKVVCLDEEGVVYRKKIYIKERTSKKTLELTSKVFCWGNEHKSMLKNAYPTQWDKFVVTGSPRVDLWRTPIKRIAQEKAAKINQSFGNFVLVVSNFSASINANGPDFITEQQKKYGLVTTKEEINDFDKNLAYHQKIYNKFWEGLISVITSLSDVNFIIRPHPGDDMSIWKNIEKNHENVQCIFSGNLSEWILASDLIIQNNCTSAVEAFFLKKNAVSFIPFKVKEEYELNIPNNVSIRINNRKDLRKGILEMIGKKDSFLNGDKDKVIKENILFKENLMSADFIVDQLSNIFIAKVNFNLLFVNLKSIIPRIKRKILKKFSKLDDPQVEFVSNYKKQKNPGYDISEITAFLEKLKLITGRFSKIKVTQINKNTFLISK